MTRIERTNPIYVAIAAPGAGKTETLLDRLPALIATGERVVLALPTLALIDEVTHRALVKGITCTPIDHRAGEIVVNCLERALSDPASRFIICTQESIRRVKYHLLSDWFLVLDEVPKVVDYPDYTPKSVELDRILQYTVERDGRLHIREGKEEVVRDQVTTHRGDARGTDCSTLGNSAAHIFRLLLSKVPVFIDKPMESGKRHIRAVEEFTMWWDIFSAARESHLLAASIEGGEFEAFAQAHGFRIAHSDFTPEWRPLNSSVVTIYPVVPKGQIFSKSLMTAENGDERLLDSVLASIKKVANTTPLLFANRWACFEHAPGVRYAATDSRGLNAYAGAVEAAVLFGGNPSPAERMGLEYLESKYDRSFEQAFVTTRLLESSLQAVTRTAVRCQGNTRPISLFVQDSRVVDYLLSTYFPDATVDWSLSKSIPVKRDRRKLDEHTEIEVNRLISLGTRTSAINKATGVSRLKIQKMKAALLAA